MRTLIILFIVALLTQSVCAEDPVAREHLSSMDNCYVGRSIPGLVAPHWSGEQYVGDVAILDLTRLRSEFEKVKTTLARFNRGELNDVVIRLASPLVAPYAVIDLDRDGHLDLLIDTEAERSTLVWSTTEASWRRTELPAPLGPIGARIFFIRDDGAPSLLIRSIAQSGSWHFVDGRWAPDASLIKGLEIDKVRVLTSAGGHDRGVRAIDLNGDGHDELVVANPQQKAVFEWSTRHHRWERSSITWPKGAVVVTEKGGDGGVRLADLNGDGHDDLLVSNDDVTAVYLIDPEKSAYSRLLIHIEGDEYAHDAHALPVFASGGQSQAAWFDLATRSVLRSNDDREAGPALPWNKAVRFKLVFGDAIAGFSKVVQNDGGRDVWFDYRGEKSPNFFIRQQKRGSTLSWRSAEVARDSASDRITFVFVGAMGFRSQQATEGFELSINGESSIRFDVSENSKMWTDDQMKCSLSFEVTWRSEEDAAGIFRVTVDRAMVESGKSVTFAVTSLGEGSARWFALHPELHPPLAPELNENDE